ncbi:hypothetical protein DdX_02564 [Ditylenchus destructor]|uniref:Uncharacterized protein n=1 Tax=Ditylenchus destructor TaxID=166010 RepID=A0AAD4NEH0_9BILA|nr:hypothetical protein DdX_02564 [Ditylenchus destructor]
MNQPCTSNQAGQCSRTSPKNSTLKYVDFQCFQHFSLSRKHIRDICGDEGHSTDIHIVFLRPCRLPSVGVSCLSLSEMLSDGAQVCDDLPTKLPFIRMLSPQEMLGHIAGLPEAVTNDVLTIRLFRPEQSRFLLMKFTFQGNSLDPLKVPFYPCIYDYSLVIGLNESSKDCIDCFTNYGYLKYITERQQRNQRISAKPRQTNHKTASFRN